VRCFNGHPPLGVNATYDVRRVPKLPDTLGFQWAPTLGGECYRRRPQNARSGYYAGFNGHPPLGVNATFFEYEGEYDPRSCMFQWAPTLGGECYVCHGLDAIGSAERFNGHPPLGVNATGSCTASCPTAYQFQWAPTLGGECYADGTRYPYSAAHCFNGHPPLGVNATRQQKK